MKQKTGNEHFTFEGMPSGFLLNDFWRWHSSDLVNNTLRGALAEFIVARALGLDTSNHRIDWGAYDLLFDELRIEIKATAFIQSWQQKGDSLLRFSIRPTRVWDSMSGFAEEQLRQSDMYIFCVFAERNRESPDPMQLDKWEFYPVLTRELNAMLGAQKTATLGTLLRFCPEPCDYESLRDAVIWLASDRGDTAARQRLDVHNALKQAKIEG